MLPFKRKRGFLSNSRKYDVVFWEIGQSKALTLFSNIAGTWLPGLSIKDTEKLIENLMISLEANGKKTIKDWQFVCLLIPIVIVAVIVSLQFFGVHLSIGGLPGTTVTNSTHNAVPTLTPLPFKP